MAVILFRWSILISSLAFTATIKMANMIKDLIIDYREFLQVKCAHEVIHVKFVSYRLGCRANHHKTTVIYEST